MPGRLPIQEDFPTGIKVSITPPPQSKPAVNILILLHGLGDSLGPFMTLGTRLCLPETACVSVQGPTPLPFDLEGFHWGDDIIFDQGSGHMDIDTGFERALRLVGGEIIRTVLVERCGFSPRELIIFGFGQGGMVGLNVARSLEIGQMEMGGVVSVGGPLPKLGANNTEVEAKSKTPVLVLHGSSKSLITTSAAKKIKDTFRYPQFHEWKRPGDGMPTNREEMLPIMHFFARRLKSQAGVPHGSQEIA